MSASNRKGNNPDPMAFKSFGEYLESLAPKAPSILPRNVSPNLPAHNGNQVKATIGKKASYVRPDGKRGNNGMQHPALEFGGSYKQDPNNFRMAKPPLGPSTVVLENASIEIANLYFGKAI